jgi:hypothetical protein
MSSDNPAEPSVVELPERRQAGIAGLNLRDSLPLTRGYVLEQVTLVITSSAWSTLKGGILIAVG